MLDMLKTIQNSWLDFGKENISLILYWLALVWLFLYEKKRKDNPLYLFSIFSCILILGLQVVYGISGRTASVKFFYILPTAILLAYTAVAFTGQFWQGKKKWIIVVLYAIIIQSGTGLLYTDSYMMNNFNLYKVSPTVIRIADCIETRAQVEDPFLLAPEVVATQIQEYDVNIRVAYGEGYNYTDDSPEQLVNEAETYGCNLILIDQTYDNEEYFKSEGYQLVIIFYGYCLYSR